MEWLRSFTQLVEQTLRLNSDQIMTKNKVIQFEESGPKYKINSFDVSGIIKIDSINDHEQGAHKAETLSIEISQKPLINLVWAGVLIMAVGLCIVYVRRKV